MPPRVEGARRGHTGRMTASDLLDPTSITAALADLSPDWSGGPAAITRELRFADAPTAVRFVSDLYAVCEERDHHADLALSYDTVVATLTTHSAGGVTRGDVELAYEVDRIAAALPRHDG